MKLSDSLSTHIRILPEQKKALARIGIETVLDILYHFPSRYGDTADIRTIASLLPEEIAVIFGRVKSPKTKKAFRSKIPMAELYVEDETGRIKCVFFNQAYIAKMFPEDTLVRIEGKVSTGKKRDGSASPLSFSNPKIEKAEHIPEVGASLFGGDEGEAHHLHPVYPETRGITSNWLHHAIKRVLSENLVANLIETIPDAILEKYHLPRLETALIWIHMPKTAKDAVAARKRFAFEEIFAIQLGKERARRLYEDHKSLAIPISEDKLIEFTKRFPFALTKAQDTAIHTIAEDLARKIPMSRFLHGDVGSGKTAVAAACAFGAIATPAKTPADRLQIAYMCPTEILAKQQFESFISYFSYLPIEIALMTGSGCKKFPSKVNPKLATDISRNQLLKWVAEGKISVVVGTHSIIQEKVKFRKLALAIIDEQHRFGLKQRQKLVQKDGHAPHLLSMSATPIPRTLALTLYGDLDLTLLDENPPGRIPIQTEIVLPHDRKSIYERIRALIAEGRQAYVICPRIDEPDPDLEKAVIAKSVEAEAKHLKKTIFPEFEIGTLHGKMSPKRKEETMADFVRGDIQILVATSVIEVGVNVPNASVIIIEGGERYGLAQLHQLRGRVMRGNHAPYCFVFTESESDKTAKRLGALKNAKNGFELAEFDLAARGPGAIYGIKQWGLSDIAMDALQNLKLVEAARAEARAIIARDPNLDSLPILKAEVESLAKSLHFE